MAGTAILFALITLQQIGVIGGDIQDTLVMFVIVLVAEVVSCIRGK